MAGERMATLSFLTKEEEEEKVGGGKILLIVVKNRVTYGASLSSSFSLPPLCTCSHQFSEKVSQKGEKKKGGPSTG